ncbi:metal ABC transporter permease [Scrofimicrobium sp. R131]|uniref:Metal ABC transporter permease n=1 Tax=Scrofimicrobium appendicitidis TaxID=3079930 RepID=A0AAU7V9P0_9ACTO
MIETLLLRSLLAAVLVGLSAPIVGTYLVQRRLAMLGDGIGHVALTGVALGWLVGTATNLVPVDQLAIPGAILTSIIGAVVIELVRRSGRSSADVALAILFYGGIAGGVLLMGVAGGTSTQLNSYLFGSLATVTWMDITIIGVLAAVVIALGVGLGPALFSVCNDEDFAQTSGLPVRGLSMLIAVMSALTVAISMRVVGALLVSAVMIIPVAIVQLWRRPFRQTMALASILGAVLSASGLWITTSVDLSPGAMIVMLAIGVYALMFVGVGQWRRWHLHHREKVVREA